MGLDHDQETHPSILNSSTEPLENMEKFPTNRRPQARQMEEIDVETVENWFLSTPWARYSRYNSSATCTETLLHVPRS